MTRGEVCFTVLMTHSPKAARDYSRFTVAVPDPLRLEAERIADAQDRTLAQLARRGLRLALEESRGEVVISTPDAA